MSHPTLTIHTATYNRAHTLPAAYASLCAQTCFDFEWLVTDDGSTDGTEQLISQWMAENVTFPIHYIRLEHGGLIRALNTAVSQAQGDYYFRLDSDDVLTPDAAETIISKIPEIDDIPDFVGVGFVIIRPDGVPLKGTWPVFGRDGYADCTNLERGAYGLDADMREAYKLEVMRRYPFPVWDGELFAPEQLQMDAMAMDGYRLRWYGRAVYVCEYLKDGLTQGNWNLLRNNKMGYAMLSNQRLLYTKDFKASFKAAAQHIALSITAGHPSYILKSNKPWLTALALPYGLALSVRRREQFRWDDPIGRRNFT